MCPDVLQDGVSGIIFVLRSLIRGGGVVQALLEARHPAPATVVGQAASQEHIVCLVWDRNIEVRNIGRVGREPIQACRQHSSKRVEPLNVCAARQHTCTQQSLAYSFLRTLVIDAQIRSKVCCSGRLQQEAILHMCSQQQRYVPAE